MMPSVLYDGCVLLFTKRISGVMTIGREDGEASILPHSYFLTCKVDYVVLSGLLSN
jgi:hypothetical protein